jgi:hypothetical protein
MMTASSLAVTRAATTIMVWSLVSARRCVHGPGFTYWDSITEG